MLKAKPSDAVVTGLLTSDIPHTAFGEELRRHQQALDSLERLRLESSSPSSLEEADHKVDTSVAVFEGKLLAEPFDHAAATKACEWLVAAVVDLLAATVASDEGKVERYTVPVKSLPDMIDFFDDSFKVPVDMAVEGWRCGGHGTAIDRWRQQLDFHIREARHGVAMSRLGTTIYHESPQSNQVPIVALLAHCLSLWTWLTSSKTSLTES